MEDRPSGRALMLAAVFVCAPAAAHEPGDDDEKHAPGTTAPVLVERVAADYPEAARRAGLGGTVGLEIEVGADGAVSAVKVARSAGAELDAAAVAAARRFRFHPATENGKPVPSLVLFDQRFVMRPHLGAETTASPPPTEAPAAPGASIADEPAVAAPRFQTTIEGRAPTTSASATTVRDQDFELRPRGSPNDLLQAVPGLVTAQHQGGGKADQIFLRGFDADHGTDVAIFLDGVPINLPSHAHGQGYADLNFLIPETIERIDVEKGPYDVRWGDFATAGAVNLVTRDRFESSSAQITLGGFPTVDGRWLASERFVGVAAPTLSGAAAKLHTWLAVEAAHDDGPFDSPERLLRYNLFGKLAWDLTPSTTVGLFVQSYGSSWDGSGQIPQREVRDGNIGRFGALDPSEGGSTQRQMATLFLRHRDADDELTATLYVTRSQLALWNDFTFFLGDPTNGSEIEQDDARVFAGARVDWHFHRRWRSISFRTTIGAETRWDGIHVDRFDAESCGAWRDLGSSPSPSCPNGDFRKRLSRHVDTGTFAFDGNNDDVQQLGLGAFVEEDVRIARWVRLVAGMRADYFGFRVNDLSEQLGAGMPNTSGTAGKTLFSPRASAIFSPVPGALDLYLNYGQGFHTNMAQVALIDGRQLTDADGHRFTVRAVPVLYGGELGARLHLFNRLDVTGAFWLSYLQNETVFDADAAAFVPSDATRRLGVDAEVRLRILRWLDLDYDVAWASATAVPDAGNGGAIALAPRLYMTGGLTVRTRFGLRGRLGVRYLGPRPAFDEASPEYQYFTSKTLSNGMANPDYDPSRVTTEGYTVVDASVAYRWRFLEASLAVQNLLDTQWREAQFGNRSCTYDETYNSMNPNYSGSGNRLADGTYADRCGIRYGAGRSGVVDVHYTPGVPLDLQLTLKAYF